MNSTDPETLGKVFHNPHILLSLQWDTNLSSFEGYRVIDDIFKSKSGRPLVIISTGFEGQAASFLNAHEYKGVMIQALVVPGRDDFEKANIMNDIAECTGTLLIGNYMEVPPEGAGMYNCGEAKQIKINQDWDGKNSYNTIIGGKGASYKIEYRIDEIREDMPDPDSEFFDEEDKVYFDQLNERINSFSVDEGNYKFKYVGDKLVLGNEPPS